VVYKFKEVRKMEKPKKNILNDRQRIAVLIAENHGLEKAKKNLLKERNLDKERIKELEESKKALRKSETTLSLELSDALEENKKLKKQVEKIGKDAVTIRLRAQLNSEILTKYIEEKRTENMKLQGLI
jgi:PP-loop superfamily ATP-utilizing enzyme